MCVYVFCAFVCLVVCEMRSNLSSPAVGVEVPFGAVVFQELLHRGTFKTVHRAIINCPARGMSGLEVAVKRLKGVVCL